jgi:DNA primase
LIDVHKLIDLADENIEQILTALNIDYKFESDWICMQCCFHGGDGYNLKYRDKSFYCFSQCQRGYSVINVVQKVLDLDFKQAITWLCNQLNVAGVDFTIDETKIAARNKLKLLKSMKTTHKKIEYKPLEQDVLNSVQLCYPKYLLEQGFKKDTLKQFGISYGMYGALQNRVVFPIDAPDGTIIALSGRLPNASALNLPKYKITANANINYTLYNISRIPKNDRYVIVVEGFKSVMSLYEWGFKSTVAVVGANLSVEQRNLLLGLGRKIIVIGDADEAGKKLNQQVYNQCYKFVEVVKVDLSEFTDIKKSSPCEQDLGFDIMCELTEKLNEIIRG